MGLYLSVCLHTYICIYTYIRMFIFVYFFMYIYLSTHRIIYIIFVFTNLCAVGGPQSLRSIYMFLSICVYVCLSVYIQTNTYTHTCLYFSICLCIYTYLSTHFSTSSLYLRIHVQSEDLKAWDKLTAFIFLKFDRVGRGIR